MLNYTYIVGKAVWGFGKVMFIPQVTSDEEIYEHVLSGGVIVR